MATNYPVNPRVRAFGKARIDIARRARSPEDWQKLWKRPAHSFPFAWGNSWKQCVEYKVDDFAAEVGFFIDVLGLPINAFDPDYAMFTSPNGDFYFSVVPALEGQSTPPDALRLQFMVADIFATAAELEGRGIVFENPPAPVQPGSSLHVAWFRTPHGICVDLWGIVQLAAQDTHQPPAVSDEEDDEDIFLPSRSDQDLFTIQDAAPRVQNHASHEVTRFEEEDEDLDQSEAGDETDDQDEPHYVDIDSA
jgi:catechol 2,3-dioxygenase-like lactoylglutathione lyase family enzyme